MVTDKNGNDYVIFIGTAADYNIYDFIYDVSNGKVLRAEKYAKYNYKEYSNFIVASISENEMITDKWIVGLSESNAFKYEITDYAKDNFGEINLTVLQNGDLLFWGS